MKNDKEWREEKFLYECDIEHAADRYCHNEVFLETLKEYIKLDLDIVTEGEIKEAQKELLEYMDQTEVLHKMKQKNLRIIA